MSLNNIILGLDMGSPLTDTKGRGKSSGTIACQELE